MLFLDDCRCFFGMATKFAEGLLAVKYRVVAKDGHSLGGPFYYIEQGMGKNGNGLLKYLLSLAYVSDFSELELSVR